MQDIQEIFNRIENAKKEKKSLEEAYKEALDASAEYKELKEKIRLLQTKKKQIEMAVREGFLDEFTKIDDLKIDIASDMELLADIAVSQLMKCGTVQVVDNDNNEYEPVFKVTFKRKL